MKGKGEGSKNSNASLSEKEASEVKFLAHNSELTQPEIGKKYNVCRRVVSDIKNENTYPNVTQIKP